MLLYMKIISERKEKLILSLYSQGFGLNPVAAMAGCSATAVRRVVMQAGVKRDRKDAGRLKADSNPLQWGQITAKRAWFLGLVYGDGGFHKSGLSMTLTVDNKDLDVLNKVQALLKYKGTINIRTSPD